MSAGYQKFTYMTAKELLNPRFEVVAEYPGSFLKKGTVLLATITDHFDYMVGERGPHICKIEAIENYPHLFRKMDWWERRAELEMPKKVKSLAFPDSEPMEIEKWDMNILFGFENESKRQGASLTGWKPEFGYIPVD